MVKIIFDTGTNDRMVILNEVIQDDKLHRLKCNLEHNPDVLFDEVFALVHANQRPNHGNHLL